MTRQLGLNPDAVVLGKTIGGGIPVGAFGMSQKLADRISNALNLETIDVGGVGGTLAGNALSMAAVNATLSEVLTEANFSHMTAMAIAWESGVQKVIDQYQLDWQVSRVGCRAEFSFRPTAPKTGREAADAEDFELQQFLQLHAINNGILMTPFHNMALFSPSATLQDVERHNQHFETAVKKLVG
jgi:glutamate-1-semialdehyde aminotransferase